MDGLLNTAGPTSSVNYLPRVLGGFKWALYHFARALPIIFTLYQVLVAPVEFGFRDKFSDNLRAISLIAVFGVVIYGCILQHKMQREFSYKYVSSLVWLVVDAAGVLGYFSTTKLSFLHFCLVLRLLSMRYVMGYHDIVLSLIEKIDILPVRVILKMVGLRVIQIYWFHVAACLLFYTATTGEHATGWVDKIYGATIKDTHFLLFYCTSFYFAAVTISTVGFGDISPLLWYERLVTVGIINISTADIFDLCRTAREAHEDRSARAEHDRHQTASIEGVLAGLNILRADIFAVHGTVIAVQTDVAAVQTTVAADIAARAVHMAAIALLDLPPLPLVDDDEFIH